MSRLRDAAARWVEAGKWIGEADAYHRMGERIRACPPETTAQQLWRERGLDVEHQAAVGNAARFRDLAEREMLALEHPGARLARRLVATVRGARAAWHASR